MKSIPTFTFILMFSGSLLASESGAPHAAQPGYVNYDYPAASSGDGFSSLRTGSVNKAGIYEPAYLNYSDWKTQVTGNTEAHTGKVLSSGVFEPTYLNYCAGSV